jgi:glyoxylase-like metal-dependent hydrolase (beta-lactamase superfamily II)
MLKRFLNILLTAAAAAWSARAGAAPEFPRVHTFPSGANGIFSNAYLVETEHSVVAIDATLLDSTAGELHARLVALGKPLKAVLLTHGHPDHYNGVTRLIAGSTAEVIATAGTDRVIRESDAAKERQWRPVFGAEWPAKRTFPNRIFRDGEALEVDGATFAVHDLGPGESESDAYWLVQCGGREVAFIGDAVLHGVHAYMSDGHSARWLENLDRLARDLRGVARLYPGHGEAGGLELIEWQRRYLCEYRVTVKAVAAGRAALSDEAKGKLAEHMTTFLPSQKFAFLIPLGADAVARELSETAVDETRTK